MLKIKPGVDLSGLRPEMLIAVQVANDVHAALGYETIITSARDGRHSKGSLHYVGMAIDLRTRHLPDRATAWKIRRSIKAQLGDQFDVVLESDHTHIEYQPKEAIL